MTSRQCKNDPSRSCFICGELTFAKEKCSITSHIKKLYKAYFHCDIGDQDKSWASHVCCLTIVKTLSTWYARKNFHMKFGVPMIWHEQKDHSNHCYFCQQDYTAVLQQRKKTLFTQICNRQCAQLSTQKICLYQNPRSGNVEFQQWR